GTNLVICAGVLAFYSMRRRLALSTSVAEAPLPGQADKAPSGLPSAGQGGAPGRVALPLIAFLCGLAALSCEVLWLRHLVPLSNVAYTFPTILGIYLLGIGVGSIIYRLFLSEMGRPLRVLAHVLLLLGLAVGLCFVVGVLAFGQMKKGTVGLWSMTAITVAAPTVLMGMAFPLICAAYARNVSTVGASVGTVYALNTLGAIAGSVLPVFVLIPVLGVQGSMLLICTLYWLAALGVASLSGGPGRWARVARAGGLAAAAFVLFAFVAPSDLCQRVIVATDAHHGRHREIIFYREGRTSTTTVVQDRVNGIKHFYVNGTLEAPTTYTDMVSFKLMGGLGPLLHPNPQEVLMVCFGGGMSSGAAAQYPQVRSVEAIDLESTVVQSAEVLAEENNAVLNDPKLSVTIEDGRNYLLMSRRKWPVIVSDSLHPKSSDAWLLYTREFYQAVRDHLSGDGIYIQWVPFEQLSVTEYRIIVRTFQSVFPHASIWLAQGVTETGYYGAYTLLVGTVDPLAVDVHDIGEKLSVPAVAADLRPWALDTPLGVLETFVCGEEMLRAWTGQGPINTDDMPYVQYETRYSGGPECSVATLAPLMESLWPYVTRVGDQEDAERLRGALARRVEANRLLLGGQMMEALAMLPQDRKLRSYRRNLDEGKRWISQVAEYYPESPSALTWLAMRAMAVPGNWDQAIGLFEKALGLEPEDAFARMNLGYALMKRGALDEAVIQYRQALRLEPDSAVAHANLGVVPAAQGRLQEATAELSEALKLDDTLGPVHRSLGAIRYRQGDLRGAEACLSKALTIDPDDAAARDDL
ncbi:MAG: fused MFS/spermidine synthase, partial [Planctomycetota bacterium]